MNFDLTDIELYFYKLMSFLLIAGVIAVSAFVFLKTPIYDYFSYYVDYVVYYIGLAIDSIGKIISGTEASQY